MEKQVGAQCQLLGWVRAGAHACMCMVQANMW
jgi:hypothetical protein